MSRFPHTYCSQCGLDLGPGDAGVSSCADHPMGRRRAAPKGHKQPPRRRIWIKRDAVEDAMLADFLALAMEDEWAARIARQRMRSLLGEVFRAADPQKLGADTCNEVQHVLRWP